MKSISRKAIVISVITLITLPAVSYATWNGLQKPVEEVKTPAKSVVAPVEKTEPVETAPVQEPVTAEPVAPTAPVEAPAPAPVAVLSTQEYALKYLDMNQPAAQECFDALVNHWPERFTPEVRENNVKALRTFGNPCGTGSHLWKTNAETGRHLPVAIEHFGVNGEFFDHPGTKAYHY